jgi:hypothetical protein
MDIKANVNLALEGKFKVDIFNKSGELIESTDWFNNFITPTGLSYVYNYKFADCFRFLSIGTGDALNSGNASLAQPTGTTGLHKPINYIHTNLSSGVYPNITGWSGVAYTGNPYQGTLSGQYIGPWGYSEEGQAINETPTGPRYYRSWRMPYYESVVANNDLTISEFMVSPSSGSDSAGNKAFSRVRRDVRIPKDTYAYISYQLGINMSSSTIQVFGSGTFDTGNAEDTYESVEVAQWAKLSGYYRQTYHGLAWIDDAGQTFVSKYGAIMEPSWTGMDECRFYLSTDNGEFNVSKSGGAQSNESLAYAADGLLQYVTEPPYEFTDSISNPEYESSIPSADSEKLPQNIRFKGVAPHMYDYTAESENNISILKVDDYRTFSNATMGVNEDAPSGLYSDSPNFGNKVLISTKGFNLPVSGDQTGRTRTLIRRHSFMPSKSLGKNVRFGSLVYAFRRENEPSNAFWPMIDCMFYDSSGQHILAHYREITGVYLTNRGSGILEAYTYTIPTLDNPFTHKTFQGPGTGELTEHPVLQV